MPSQKRGLNRPIHRSKRKPLNMGEVLKHATRDERILVERTAARALMKLHHSQRIELERTRRIHQRKQREIEKIRETLGENAIFDKGKFWLVANDGYKVVVDPLNEKSVREARAQIQERNEEEARRTAEQRKIQKASWNDRRFRGTRKKGRN